MKARILYVDTGKEWGGGTNSLLLLARGLLQRGYRVDAAFTHDYAGTTGRVSKAFTDAGIAFHLLHPAASPWHKTLRELIRLALVFGRDWRETALHWIDCRLRVEPMARQLAALARESGATLLVGNNQPSSNREVLRAGQRAGLPVMLHVRKTTRLLPAERDLANSVARRIVCVSDSVRSHYIEQGLRADLCITVPNGIDPESTNLLPRGEARARLDLPMDAFVVGTVCSLLPLKCVDHLIEAFAAARPLLGARAVCVVIGEGRERSRLELLTRKLGVGDAVRFTGFRDDAVSLLPALDVFVLASRQEGMPRSILEAMLAERPVVAANVSGCRDVVTEGETGMLYPQGDVAQLAARLQTLAGDTALCRRMGERGRAVVMERYTLATHIDRMAAVIDEVAAQ